jgi:hypothetical protein
MPGDPILRLFHLKVHLDVIAPDHHRPQGRGAPFRARVGRRPVSARENGDSPRCALQTAAPTAGAAMLALACGRDMACDVPPTRRRTLWRPCPPRRNSRLQLMLAVRSQHSIFEILGGNPAVPLNRAHGPASPFPHLLRRCRASRWTPVRVLSRMTVEFVRLNGRHCAARQRHFWCQLNKYLIK